VSWGETPTQDIGRLVTNSQHRTQVNVTAIPEITAQSLALRTEHLANMKCPDSIPSVGLIEQPSRKLKDIACLTGKLDIGGSKAYILFDTGSNTNLLTPEYARATGCKVFKLDEQVTLQLGCVGSKSRINYGARTPVNFGGIKGFSYFDLVNLDRYDGIIGTPFMVKHWLVLDFGTRKIHFSSGHVLAALSLPEEMSIIRSRTEASPCKAPTSH
jgi:hypothetical protein